MEISAIEALALEYQTLSRGMVDHVKYNYYAITHHSTAIEGSSLTEPQATDLLEFGKTAKNKPFEDHQMVVDHYKALQFTVNEAETRKMLSVELIQKIVSEVMKNTGGYVNTVMGTYDIAKGDFRLGTVRAGSRTFPDYKKVPGMVQALCDEINKELTTVQTFRDKCNLAFKVHFEFVSIHPFGDGNGRTSRLLMNYIQAYFNLPLSVVFKQDRIRYINALEASRTTSDITPFYHFMDCQYAKFLKKEIAALK